ncbi:hypothetical protein J437_LFUL007379 [Ladona fulva]|uniref:Leucine-rich repeat-containing protein 59 n=1 Tax=Ladona fulva TaxID=123851 RepID=A0A8K0K2L4_LADFU|nr:hypothetical protein J437_LFUL007379 [Ladona fulva]
MAKLNLKDRFEDGELDLSMSDLEEVPVKEINAMKKAKSLDLSNNRIAKLGKNFATMTHIIKLDLGKNLLTELPENFGDMVQLKHLDLYGNKIDRLPLSFGKLSNLKWLDLKGNPLTPKLAEVAGQCLDAAECAKCARSVVALLRNMAVSIEEEKARREQQRQLHLQQQAEASNNQNASQGQKKDKKKKKKAENADNQQKKASVAESKKSSKNQENLKQQNGSGVKTKVAKEQKKGRSLGFYLFLLLINLMAIASLALYFVDENLFWKYVQTTQIFFKETVATVHNWWETKGLQGVKDWAGGGLLALEAAKTTIVQLYYNISAEIPAYVESVKKLF